MLLKCNLDNFSDLSFYISGSWGYYTNETELKDQILAAKNHQSAIGLRYGKTKSIMVVTQDSEIEEIENSDGVYSLTGIISNAFYQKNETSAVIINLSDFGIPNKYIFSICNSEYGGSANNFDILLSFDEVQDKLNETVEASYIDKVNYVGDKDNFALLVNSEILNEDRYNSFDLISILEVQKRKFKKFRIDNLKLPILNNRVKVLSGVVLLMFIGYGAYNYHNSSEKETFPNRIIKPHTQADKQSEQREEEEKAREMHLRALSDLLTNDNAYLQLKKLQVVLAVNKLAYKSNWIQLNLDLEGDDYKLGFKREMVGDIASLKRFISNNYYYSDSPKYYFDNLGNTAIVKLKVPEFTGVSKYIMTPSKILSTIDKNKDENNLQNTDSLFTLINNISPSVKLSINSSRGNNKVYSDLDVFKTSFNIEGKYISDLDAIANTIMDSHFITINDIALDFGPGQTITSYKITGNIYD